MKVQKLYRPLTDIQFVKNSVPGKILDFTAIKRKTDPQLIINESKPEIKPIPVEHQVIIGYHTVIVSSNRVFIKNRLTSKFIRCRTSSKENDLKGSVLDVSRQLVCMVKGTKPRYKFIFESFGETLKFIEELKNYIKNAETDL
jgi:hypothetical protein